MTDVTDRFERQRGIVPSDRLKTQKVTVIGIGAIGRQVAIQLAAIGVRDLQLIDFDNVEAVNVTTQGYLASDIGKPKVVATGEAVKLIEPNDLQLSAINDRYRRQQETADAVFCCVDSITDRKLIWDNLKDLTNFWADGRMLGEVMKVLVATNDEEREYYLTTLFEQAEAQTGACTARSTIYTANIAAGLMVHQFTRWLRNVPVEKDFTLNLLSAECMVS